MNSSLSQSALILVSGEDLIAFGRVNFHKVYQSLVYSPPLLQPTKSPAKYSSHFYNLQVQFVKQRHTSLEISPSFLRVSAHLTASIVPLLILCNSDSDDNKCSSSIWYDWMNMYQNSNAYLTTWAEWTCYFVKICFCNSSNIPEMFSIDDSRYKRSFLACFSSKYYNLDHDESIVEGE